MTNGENTTPPLPVFKPFPGQDAIIHLDANGIRRTLNRPRYTLDDEMADFGGDRWEASHWESNGG